MKNTTHLTTCFRVTALTLLLAVPVHAADHAALVKAVQQADRCPGGLQVVIGAGHVDLALALAGTGKFDTQILVHDAASLQRERATILQQQAYDRASVLHDRTGCRALPYTDNLLNRVVFLAWSAAVEPRAAAGEVARVLAPGGMVYCDAAAARPALLASGLRAKGAVGTLEAFVKPWPADIDEWTHYTHGADGNAVARDRKVGPPRRYQWFAEPQWMRTHESESSFSAMVSADGRIYTIADFAPAGLFGPEGGSGDWYLSAQDAFNGQYLWSVPIRQWGWEYWQTNWFMGRPGDMPLNLQKRLVAQGDKVYATLGYRAAVSELDGRTGDILKTYPGTAGTNEIIVKDNLLIAAVLNVNAPGKYRERAEDQKAGSGAKVKAFDRRTGRLLWETGTFYRGAKWNYVIRKDKNPAHNTFELDPALSIATDGKVVALSDDMNVVALDAQTGKQKWTVLRLDQFSDGAVRDRAVSGGVAFMQRQNEEQEARRAAARKGAVAEMWIGSIIVSDGVVLQGNAASLMAFDADTGKVLWEAEKGWIHHLWYTWQENYVIDGVVWTWGKIVSRRVVNKRGKKQNTRLPETLNGYDIRTGELKKSIPTKSIFAAGHHHRCYRGKATERFVVASHRGVELIDVENEKLHVDRWVRSTCHLGFMPANGLLYAPPHPCRCFLNEKLSYMNALAAETPAPPTLRPDAPERLTRGRAYGFQGTPAKDTDWPAFRHDSARSGGTPALVGGLLKVAWEKPIGVRPTAPAAAAGLLFFGDRKASVVTALSQGSGAVAWQRGIDGPMDSPSTYHNGTLIFGSGSGKVTCLKATTGELVWQFLAATLPRQICALGRFESASPSHGAVTVRDNTVYCSAGRSSFLDGGIQLYALDAATGEVKQHRTLSGPFTDFNTFEGDRDGLPLGYRTDVMLAGADGFHMLGQGYDWQFQRVQGRSGPVFITQSGFLDGDYFKRTHWNFQGGHASVLVHNAESIYSFRMFDSTRALTSEVFFTPGTKGYALLKYERGPKNNLKAWEVRLPLRAPAVLATPERVFLGGIPDVVPKQDPYAAYKGRLGGELYVVSAVDGSVEQKLKIPGEPVFNGIAATPGKLFLTLRNGAVIGLAAPSVDRGRDQE